MSVSVFFFLSVQHFVDSLPDENWHIFVLGVNIRPVFDSGFVFVLSDCVVLVLGLILSGVSLFC